MKVLYILHSTLMGGATISFKNMLLQVIKKNVYPIVIIPKNSDYGNDLENWLKNNRITYFSCHIVQSVYPKKSGVIPIVFKYLKKVISYFELSKVIKSVKPDIIHTNTGVVHEGFHVAKRNNIPHVWHLREYQELDFNMRIFPSKGKFIDYLTNSITVCITNDIQNYFGLSNIPNSTVIYNPIYSKEEIPVEISKKEDYFLIANRVSPEKGIEDILRGFALYCNQFDCETKLMIAGICIDDLYENKILRLIKELSISDRVVFLGHINNVKDYLIKSKGLFVGSFNEGFGRMSAEANMLGIPVIGRNSAGTKEIIELTRGGFLFNDHIEIPNLLKRIVDMNKIEYERWVCNFKKIAVEEYSSEQNGNKIYSLYESIVKEKED